ncbi:hypothetical protein, partial [Duganella qianjiadongensis]|uniref:hypothetical protein n=1 Tax=Duganella qianjiadongensis TaxID=2692176 RepID=UPI001E4550B0
ALCSSAKRQDYEAFQTFRQVLLFNSLNSALGALFCEGANYSKSDPLPSSLIFRWHFICFEY